MLVRIIHSASNKVVTEVPIQFATIDQSENSLARVYEEAWRCAVEDLLVDPGEKSDYRFEVG